MILTAHVFATLARIRPGRGALARRTDGQGLVEFILVIPFVILLLAGIFEFGNYFYTRVTVRHSVLEAARFAVTGLILADDNGDPLTRVASIERVVRRNASTLNVDVESITVEPPDGGGPGDVVRVSVTYSYVWIIPLIGRFFDHTPITFRVSTAMKNEPWPVP